GARIDNFFLNNRIGAGTQRDWQAIRSDLEQIASYYNLRTPWGSGGSIGSGNNGYNLSDFQMRQLVDRLNIRATSFSRSLRADLNRGSYNDRYNLDDVRQRLSEFETGLTQLRYRVNSRQVTSSDARNVLDDAAFLNNYVADRQLSNQTENSWSGLR